jgi:hypothetical protein
MMRYRKLKAITNLSEYVLFLAAVSIILILDLNISLKNIKGITDDRLLTNTTDFTEEYIQLRGDVEDNLIDTKTFDKTNGRATPFYWHVAKSGGTSVQDRYAHCFGLIEASEIGAMHGHDKEETLKVVEVNESKNHVNVDVSSLDGILRASSLNLVSSNIADVIFSPLIEPSVSHLFSHDSKGQMFAMFRHPVHRVISLFYYLQIATWEPTYNPALRNMTLLEYANSDLVEANFVLRSLVNKMEGPLSWNDVKVAKEYLRRKCLVGLVDQYEASIDRFDNFFDFHPKRDNVDNCITELRKNGGSNVHLHPSIDPESEAYKILERKNGW